MAVSHAYTTTADYVFLLPEYDAIYRASGRVLLVPKRACTGGKVLHRQDGTGVCMRVYAPGIELPRRDLPGRILCDQLSR